ncbi:MAG: GNAT family N-acetyltransferase [Dysgonamonadaceae bacterium]|jgi:hypothetical protein|nr:GNAT family N-acetyltransferase [Dysgonamonadaceae bacterium]
MEITGLDNSIRWDAIIRSMRIYDVYHTSAYHALESSGTSLLLSSSFGGELIAIPVVVRRIEGTDYNDITSVYGYSGPLSSAVNPDIDHISAFQNELREFFDSRSIVSAFGRLHPFFDVQENILKGLGDTVISGKTVYIDLSLSEEQQLLQYSRSLRNRINRFHNSGNIIVRKYDTDADIDAFVSIYHETMRRVGASVSYFFDVNYFHTFLRNIPSCLFLACYDGEPVCGTLFTECNGIIQTHLSGTMNKFLHLSPLKYVRDEIRRYGIRSGFHYLHMGGGVGSRSDSVYGFKSQFSRSELLFKTWRYIHLPDVYDEMTRRRGIDNTQGADFFPLYRFGA